MESDNIYAPPKANLIIEDDENKVTLASRWQRFWGGTIDGVVAMVITFPIMYLTGYWEKAANQTITAADTIMLAVLGFALFMLLHGYFLSNYGQTIGKKLIGTKIVSSDSNNILPFWKVIVARYLPMSFAAQIPVIGGVLSLVDALFIFKDDKRCVHDLIAGTKVIVVKKRL
ncbi:MAG: RDD family protein [Gammaproteobacteria bacterium]|jgi:uncharacterized RDD family membrane protein YckC